MEKDFEFTRLERFWLRFHRITRIKRARYFLTQELPNFIKNVWIFRKSLTNFCWYNFDGTLMFIKDSLDHSIPLYETRGYEIESSLNLKIYKMKRLQWLLQVKEDHSYMELAEKEIGNLYKEPFIFRKIEGDDDYYELVSNLTPEQDEHNTKIYQRGHEIEEQHWNEIMKILKGNTIIDYKRDFDGNGIRNWWN